ncbi:hypothetical protein L210DRAFT_2264257 [Boletus edulis BED1]|uniref:DUF6533 domain-containing protein n=1 Tax=Boletus edulis BED1 TaxID=1328754 RepID=A0AAD4BRL6_BOLED|nr:hypothetical protein L210DRAFT_2264257 [Boletus edulis BED1]
MTGWNWMHVYTLAWVTKMFKHVCGLPRYSEVGRGYPRYIYSKCGRGWIAWMSNNLVPLVCSKSSQMNQYRSTVSLLCGVHSMYTANYLFSATHFEHPFTQLTILPCCQSDMSSDVQSALQLQQLNDYTSVVTLTAVIYDYTLTFSGEVDYIWHRPWTCVSTMFVLIRYIGLCWAM